MSADLAGSILGLIQRAKSLKSNSIEYFNVTERSPTHYTEPTVLKMYFTMYEGIRNEVIRLFHSDVAIHSLPSLSVSSGGRHDIFSLVAGCNQVIGFLEGKQADVLGTKVRTFPYKEEELDILPATTKLLLLEAIGEFNYFHSYACCCICGLTLESLVQEGCKKHNISYKGLAKGIEDLKEAKVIKEDLHKSLIDLEKYYRDKISAHLTSEVATDEKARLFLSSLLSLVKAIFPQEKC